MNKKAVAVAAVFLLSASAAVGHAEELKAGGTGAAHGLLLVLGKAFSATSPGDKVEAIPGLGSSGGISAVDEGALDLSVSSRPLKEQEKAKGLKSIPLVDTPFLFVTSHADSQKMTKADVVAVFDGRLTRWPDGKEIRPILRPKSDSQSAFLISNFEGMDAAMEKLRQRKDVPVAATDQDNIEAAVKISNSFAGATLIQFVTEKPRLQPISLDGTKASVETMEKGSYTLKTRLYLVMKSRPSTVAQRFVDFLRSKDAEHLIRESGGVLLSKEMAAQ